MKNTTATTVTQVTTDEASIKPRAAIYARYASRTDFAKSIEAQVGRCREYADRQGMDVAVITQESGSASAKSSARPGLISLLTAAREGAFSVILVEHISRLSRNTSDTLAIIAELNRLGVSVCTVSSGPVTELQWGGLFARDAS